MKASELKINNLVTGLYEPIAVIKSICEDELWGGYYVITEKNKTTLEMLLPIPLTETHLLQFGFTPIKTDMYINGKQWLMQIGDDYIDREAGDIINRDGTWFDGIGTHSFMKDGAMAVNVLCRGNYVCNSVKHVHQLQNLYHALTGEELTEKH